MPAGGVAERDDGGRVDVGGGQQVDRCCDVVEGRREAAAVADAAVLHVGAVHPRTAQVLGERRAVARRRTGHFQKPAMDDDDDARDWRPRGRGGRPLARVVAVGDPLGFAGASHLRTGRRFAGLGDRQSAQAARGTEAAAAGHSVERASAASACSSGRAAPGGTISRCGGRGRDRACARPRIRRGRRSPCAARRPRRRSASGRGRRWRRPRCPSGRSVSNARSTTWCTHASLVWRKTSTAALPAGRLRELAQVDGERGRRGRAPHAVALVARLFRGLLDQAVLRELPQVEARLVGRDVELAGHVGRAHRARCLDLVQDPTPDRVRERPQHARVAERCGSTMPPPYPNCARTIAQHSLRNIWCGYARLSTALPQPRLHGPLDRRHGQRARKRALDVRLPPDRLCPQRFGTHRRPGRGRLPRRPLRHAAAGRRARRPRRPRRIMLVSSGTGCVAYTSLGAGRRPRRRSRSPTSSSSLSSAASRPAPSTRPRHRPSGPWCPPRTCRPR